MIYCCLSPIQINLLDLKKDLIDDFKNKITDHKPIHSLRGNVPPKIAVSFSWDDLTAQDIYEYHKK